MTLTAYDVLALAIVALILAVLQWREDGRR
jgi:hypothetical protein